MKHAILLRAAVVVAAVLGTQAYLLSMRTHATAAAPARPLSALPRTIDAWQGQDQPPFDPETLRILAADDYLNRVYVDPSGHAAGLYIAFYASQRAGESIHSPLHCLPGNGWQPVSTSRVTLADRGRPVVVNRMVVQKSALRQLVFYWFAGRGRTVASEYGNKLWLVWDGLRTGRSEGALVRITAPVVGDERLAEATAVAFLQKTFDPLREVLK
jgi:EpsI family protein